VRDGCHLTDFTPVTALKGGVVYLQREGERFMKRIFSVLSLLALAFSVSAFSVSMSAATPKVDLSKKQVKVLTATAKTPEDHLKLAQYYDQRAELLLAKSKEHEEMAEASRKNPMSGGKFFPMSVGHCESTAKSYRQDAQKMKEVADEHRAMAAKTGM
jgi:hypothetical protein